VILVTGGTGFVGPKIVHALRAAGHDVRALVRKPERGAALGVELVEGDVTDAASLRRAVEGCDAVVHLVAIILGKPADFERVMAQGTRDLVAAARDAGVRRFVLMSALGVSEKTKELTPYYRGKWDMEQAVRGSGLEHVIFRPSFVFGSDGGALQVFIRQVRWSPVTPVIGDGKKEIQPIWVDDVAAYFAKGVDLPAAANRTFELGGPDVVTWNELYARIATGLHKRRGRLNLPVGLVRAGAAMVEWLPNAPITRDQIQMIEAGDNTCDMTPANEAFGIETVPLDEMIRRAA
jgi:uncharacterized protein YbjT (DUF2867 family)